MQIHVRNSKNHGDHWTILSERALELLKQYWYSCPEPRDVLFVSIRKPHRPLKPGAIQSMLNKVGAEAGVKVHPHVLRHSFATHLIEDDTKREYVQAMLGHRSPNSTAVYINVSNKSIMGVTSPLDKKTKKLLYDALYHAANKTLAELSGDPKHFGAKIGYICILHAWGSQLNYHPHLHTIVLGGGLDSKNHWRDKGKKFFLLVKVISAVFKKYYLDDLKDLREDDNLV